MGQVAKTTLILASSNSDGGTASESWYKEYTSDSVTIQSSRAIALARVNLCGYGAKVKPLRMTVYNETLDTGNNIIGLQKTKSLPVIQPTEIPNEWTPYNPTALEGALCNASDRGVEVKVNVSYSDGTISKTGLPFGPLACSQDINPTTAPMQDITNIYGMYTNRLVVYSNRLTQNAFFRYSRAYVNKTPIANVGIDDNGTFVTLVGDKSNLFPLGGRVHIGGRIYGRHNPRLTADGFSGDHVINQVVVTGSPLVTTKVYVSCGKYLAQTPTCAHNEGWLANIALKRHNLLTGGTPALTLIRPGGFARRS